VLGSALLPPVTPELPGMRRSLLAPLLLACLVASPVPAAEPAKPAAPRKVEQPRKPAATKPTVRKPTAPKPPSKPAVRKSGQRKAQAAPAARSAPGREVVLPALVGAGVAVAGAPALPSAADQEMRDLDVRARAGDVEAQLALAEAFSSATFDRAQDMRRARFWYEQAALRGDADAAYAMADLNRGGLAQPVDMPRAVAWYRRAAELGHAEAKYDLGLLHAEGNGVERDPVAAARWFEEAADAGIARSLFMLGILYEAGVDGAPDHETAAGWYRQAAASGDVTAADALKRLAAGGTNVLVTEAPPQIAAAAVIPAPGAAPGAARAPRPAEPPQAAAPQQARAGRPVPVDRDGVKEIQTLLKAAGYHKGRPDGHLGKRTAAAIRAYQKAKGLPVDGRATQALLQHLRGG